MAGGGEGLSTVTEVVAASQGGGDCSSQPISGLVGRAYVSFTVNEEGGQRRLGGL